jgi:hypothetical protein
MLVTIDLIKLISTLITIGICLIAFAGNVSMVEQLRAKTISWGVKTCWIAGLIFVFAGAAVAILYIALGGFK